MSQIKILISDKEVLFAGLLKILVEEHDEFHLTGIANSEKQVMDILTHKKIDVVIIVQSNPQQKIIGQLRRITENYPDTKVLLIGGITEQAYIKESLNNGANACVSKFVECRELIEAIRVVAGNGCYLCKKNLAALTNNRVEKGDNSSFGQAFTKREKEVFNLITDGLNNYEIAERLYLSVRTVETHRRNMLQKYGEKNFVSLIKSIMEQNMIRIMDLV